MSTKTVGTRLEISLGEYAFFITFERRFWERFLWGETGGNGLFKSKVAGWHTDGFGVGGACDCRHEASLLECLCREFVLALLLI